MIGIFDSGSGGLSVLREIIRLLPEESYVYFADNAYCPYGEKTPEFIQERGRKITEYLLSRGAEIIVVACNTATAAAISVLRSEFPVKFIGMEPAVKPAALSSKTGVIGVLATAGTLSGSKYLISKGIYEANVRIEEHVGQGFVELVERGVLDGPEAEATVRASLQPLLDAGADRIVLGCTHYPFLREVIQRLAGPDIQVIDPAPAVARHLLEVMKEEGLLKDGSSCSQGFPKDTASQSRGISGYVLSGTEASKDRAMDGSKAQGCQNEGRNIPDIDLVCSGDRTSAERILRLIIPDKR